MIKILFLLLISFTALSGFECEELNTGNYIRGKLRAAYDGDTEGIYISRMYIKHPDKSYLDIVEEDISFKLQRYGRGCGDYSSCFKSKEDYKKRMRIGSVFGISANREGSFDIELEERDGSPSRKYRKHIFECQNFLND